MKPLIILKQTISGFHISKNKTALNQIDTHAKDYEKRPRYFAQSLRPTHLDDAKPAIDSITALLRQRHHILPGVEGHSARSDPRLAS